MKNMRVLAVEDHKILLEGIVNLLNSFDLNLELDYTGNPLEAIEYSQNNYYDLMITDYEMPELNGAGLIKQVRKLNKDIKIIVLSMHDETFIVEELIGLNINGYVLKKNMLGDLEIAIKTVLQNGYFYSKEIDQVRISKSSIENNIKLSNRENEIMKLIGSNFSNKQIADRLLMNEKTIDIHEKNIIRKIRLNNRIELIQYANSEIAK